MDMYVPMDLDKRRGTDWVRNFCSVKGSVLEFSGITYREVNEGLPPRLCSPALDEGGPYGVRTVLQNGFIV